MALRWLARALVELVQVAHDVQHRAALVVALAQAALQRLHLRAELARGRPGLRDRGLALLGHALRRRMRPSRSQPLDFFRRLSSSFSRAIIFSSRPNDHFLEISRGPESSPAARSWTFPDLAPPVRNARMSRRIPMAPDHLAVGVAQGGGVEGGGDDLAAGAAGIETGVARDTPRHDLPERRRELPGLLGADEARERLLDQLVRRKPRSAKTASLAWRILPSRSETKTGSARS